MEIARLSLEKAVKEYMTSVVFNHCRGSVMSGPFKGMKMVGEIAWSDGNLGTKLLGCYEQELHDFIEEAIGRVKMLKRPGIVLDIGCAEGYYAVGLSLRLPEAKVIAVDELEEALRITLMAAALNEVVLETVSAKEFPYDLQPDFVLCDCEGAELDYLDPEKFPGLKNATIIVECHDNPSHPHITSTMGERFSETHEIWIVAEGSRDPNQFEVLCPFDSLMRWVAVSEGRPCCMHWLALKPKGEDYPEAME